MDNQYIGKVETLTGWRSAYLFRDDDEPEQVTLHVWGNDEKPFAVWAKIVVETLAGDEITLIPILLYITDNGGGLIPAPDSAVHDYDPNSYKMKLKLHGDI